MDNQLLTVRWDVTRTEPMSSSDNVRIDDEDADGFRATPARTSGTESVANCVRQHGKRCLGVFTHEFADYRIAILCQHRERMLRRKTI